jgi:tetratricopeptide (TPR) repeat protein
MRPASLCSLRPELDPRLDQVVLRLLAKKPEDRFNNADAFLAALDEASRPARRAPANGTAAGARRPTVREAPGIRRLAVAPFTAHFDGDTDRERAERVARGLAESVAAGLAGLEALSIIPPFEVSGTPCVTLSDMAARLGADAIVSAHLAENDDSRRLSWTLVGSDGAIFDGGRLGGPGETLFALEDALLAALIRALRRPEAAGRLHPADAREGWYAPFLEALGCLQRTDNAELVERAIHLLEEIRDGGAGGVRVHAVLGRAYLCRGETSRDPAWRERAEASCRIALSLDPLAPDALSIMGRLLVSSGRLDEAMSILRRAVELDPANVETLVWLSRAHEMAGDLEASDRYARAACADRPAYWLVHDRKAVVDFRRGRFADAANGWKRVLELTPDNTHALTNLGSALFELGALDESEQSFREAIGRSPSARALEGLGLVCFYRGSPAESMHWFERAVELAPEHSRLWGNLADAQRWSPGQRSVSMDSFDRAIGLVRRDLLSNPSDARAWCQLAVYLAKREQHVEAEAALQRAGQLGADSSPARACAVIVHELAGRRDEAISTLEKIRETTTSIPFELRCDPELGDLRACAAARDLLPSPLSSVAPQTNERTLPWPLQPFP